MAQKRHRHVNRGKFTSTYDPSASDKADFLSMCMRHMPPEPWTGPVQLIVKFFMPRPKSHYRTGKRSNELKPDAPTWVTTKPDIDNAEKFVTDSLTGKFYKDDCQIVYVEKAMVYSTSPRTVISLKHLDTQPHEQPDLLTA